MSSSSRKVKKYTSTVDYEEYHRRLRKRGFRRIGDGVYSTVYARSNTKYVYKIGTCYDMSHSQDPYLSYVKRVLSDLKGNPHCPRIMSVKLFTSKSLSDGSKERWYVIKMERLKRYNAIHETTRKKVMDDLNIEVLDQFGCWNDIPPNLMDWSKPLLKMYNTIKKLSDKFQHDVREANVMLRKTGKRYTLVFTDPVS